MLSSSLRVRHTPVRTKIEMATMAEIAILTGRILKPLTPLV
jgi:hypothetical protein